MGLDRGTGTERLHRRIPTGRVCLVPSFLRGHAPKVYYIAYGLLGSEFDAKDVSQDTYVRFISSLSSYRSGSNPYALLATIARNLAYDLLEKKNRLTSFEEEIGNEEEHGSTEVEKLTSGKRSSFNPEQQCNR